jgi:hypothetical protein
MSEKGEQQSFLREENNNHVRERRTTNISERGEQQACLRERRTAIISERGEQQSCPREETNNHV